MSFHNDQQISVCCRTLLYRVRLGRLWTLEGPSDEALELYQADGGYLSGGERALLFVVLAIWNSNNKKCLLGDVLRTLDSSHQKALWSLLIAQAQDDGGKAVNDWILQWTPRNVWRAP